MTSPCDNQPTLNDADECCENICGDKNSYCQDELEVPTCKDCGMPCSLENSGFNCEDSECVASTRGRGQFPTQDECEKNCTDPDGYNCDPRYGLCVDMDDGTKCEYKTFADCTDACVDPNIGYNCEQNQCIGVKSGPYQFSTYLQCEDHCK